MAESATFDSAYTFIEGVADEVVLVFVAGVLILVTVLAWQSTHVRQHTHTDNEQSHLNSEAESTASNSSAQGSTAGTNGGPEQPAASSESATATSTSSETTSAPRADSSQRGSSHSSATASAAVCGCAPIADDTEIIVRIKYLDERVREVRCRPHLTVGEFKTEYFMDERAANLEPRLIFNGRELRASNRCLYVNGVSQSGATIHCLTRPLRNEAESARAANDADSDTGELFDLGRFMMPLFGTFLIAIWYARVAYRHYFTAISTCALLSISFLFVVACIIVYSNSQSDPPAPSGTRTASANASATPSTSTVTENEGGLRLRPVNIVS